MPLPLLGEYVTMLPRLRAAEGLSAVSITRMGAGMLDKQGQREAQRVLHEWERMAEGRLHRGATLRERRIAAEAIGIPIRRRKRKRP